jgi:hypothetical protein
MAQAASRFRQTIRQTRETVFIGAPRFRAGNLTSSNVLIVGQICRHAFAKMLQTGFLRK